MKSANRRLPKAISKKESKPSSVWDRRAKYEKRHGRLTEDFSLPSREKQTWHNPLCSSVTGLSKRI
jgi:hypothetical protein